MIFLSKNSFNYEKMLHPGRAVACPTGLRQYNIGAQPKTHFQLSAKNKSDPDLAFGQASTDHG
jgi:hypothetical protein